MTKKEKKQGYIGTVKIGPKGQIVIPKEVRDMFELEPGDSLLLMADPSRGIALQRPNIMSKIADAILGGHSKELYPAETEEDMTQFAGLVKEETEDKE